MTTTNLHIVLSCTNRKRVASDAYPRLRDVAAEDTDLRAAAWIERVRSQRAHTVARHLYVGEYWRAGLDLADTASRYFDTRIWVLSAGLGLVNAMDIVPAYGATLASGHPDSVSVSAGRQSPSEVRRTWWSSLAAWRGPRGLGPRTLTNLAAADPTATIVICAGPDYIDAVAADLGELIGSNGSETHLLVYGSGAPPESGLETVWVRVAGRLRTSLGGSMASTGPRAVQATIEALGPGGHIDADSARRVVQMLTGAASPLPRFDRKRFDDSEILAWMRADLRAHADATKSSALRRFRDEGMACEQSRFGRLFESVSGAEG